MALIKIEKGGIWESKNFEIQTDYIVDKSDNKCEHVKDKKLRAVVIAFNEGGFNSTGICVDCLIEALRANDLIEPDYLIATG